jgi:hypothetical protein
MPTSPSKGCSPSKQPMRARASLDAANYRLESCMRENRTYSSEGGDGESRFLPLSKSS